MAGDYRIGRWLPLAIAIVAGLLVVAAGPGTRLGLWSFRSGFLLLRWGAYFGIAAAVLAILFLLLRPRGGALPSLLALLIGAGIAFVPWRWMQRAKALPPIHDISTDTENPPPFVAVLPLRANAPNPAEYGGPEIAEAQRQGYPDIQPLALDVPPGAAFARARSAAEAMGWYLVAADSAAGRLEATATTAWFGFKDDIVVRITPAGGGSRVDVRSVSRVGKSDVGANAERVRDYLRRVASG